MTSYLISLTTDCHQNMPNVCLRNKSIVLVNKGNVLWTKSEKKSLILVTNAPFFDYEIYLLINVRIQMQFIIIFQLRALWKTPWNLSPVLVTVRSSLIMIPFLSALKFNSCAAVKGSLFGILYHEKKVNKQNVISSFFINYCPHSFIRNGRQIYVA